MYCFCHGWKFCGMLWERPAFFWMLDFCKRPAPRYVLKEYPMMLFLLKSSLKQASCGCSLTVAVQLQLWSGSSPFMVPSMYWNRSEEASKTVEKLKHAECGVVVLEGDRIMVLWKVEKMTVLSPAIAMEMRPSGNKSSLRGEIIRCSPIGKYGLKLTRLSVWSFQIENFDIWPVQKSLFAEPVGNMPLILLRAKQCRKTLKRGT